MAKVLGRVISKKCSEGLWKGIKIADGVNPLCHLQFVDDTFLAGDASAREARVIRRTLDDYEQAFGQRVNWFKSEIFFFNTEPTKQREICRILGMRLGNLLSKYLGIPLFGGANKTDLWKNLVDSCLSKLDG
ncbi:uncharacterized protein LOC131047714 [Cryptomeria japonica]|uniref:uncharacterized protein LOC131047714 n=1 Tax=Cryptomeria japonica TaxID=3369 RepID=UPI0027DA1B4C|nr:uncharacterized protein LOC131047714 [Cryptomeria japonica]